MFLDFDALKDYFKFIKDRPAFQVLDDDICNDLELDLLFAKFAKCKSAIGLQYFYAKFRFFKEPFSDEFTPIIDFLKSHSAENEKVGKELSKLSKREDYQIINLIKDEVFAKENYYKYAQLSVFVIVLCIICSFFVPKILILVIPFFCGNMYFHYYNNNYVSYYNSVLSRINQMIKVSDKISEIPFFKEEIASINLRKLKSVVRFTGIQEMMQKNEFLILFWIISEIAKITFCLEIFSFRKRVKILNSSKPELLRLFEFIGKIDSAQNLIEVQKNHQICKPIFCDEKQIEVKKIYHPFIEKCVANDLVLNEKSGVITGSNMSGKTSFIRSIAVNAIFAQNFGFCFAEYYKAPPLEILTSIAVSDDIEESKSYYLEEVLRIKKFMEKRDDFSLILIDEIFKGTNTKERIAISKAVLENLNSPKNIVMITTHDLEIAQFLEDCNYNLYYFDESVNSEEISFPYKIFEGINSKTNAIKILELYNYPKEITEKAKAFLN